MRKNNKKLLALVVATLSLGTLVGCNRKAPRVEVVIENYPTKVIYNVGDNIDFSGLKVSWLLEDGNYDNIKSSEYQVTTPDTSTTGEKEVTITYEDVDLTFNIYVTNPVQHTYNDYTAVSPSNWNELTYQDNNDTQIMSFIGGSFFQFDFERDVTGKIVEGGFEVEYGAVSALKDVTVDYAGKPAYSVPRGADKGFAYKFTLRDDLKWDDGTAIKAKDFVYSMKEQENPDFFNYRADSYYNSGTVIHNAKNYLYQGQSGMFSARDVAFAKYGEEKYDPVDDENYYFRCFYSGSDVYAEDELWSAGGECGFAQWAIDGVGQDAVDLIDAYGIFVLPMAFGYSIGELVQSTADALEASRKLDQKSLKEVKADPELNKYYEAILNWWQTEPNEELDFLVGEYTYPEMDFDEVGLFVGDNDNELIIVLDKALNLFKEDGKTLSYLAAYQLSSLPLVKESLYEATKVRPQIEGGLWTSKYNSSTQTSASWGPYRLAYFQAGKQYVLERNPHWYGYNMTQFDGQYQTDRIVVDTIAEWNTAWLAFQQGDLAGIGIDVSISGEYKTSSRATFTASDFVSSLQLQSNVEELARRSDANHNKKILAYKEFRQAISLGIDRAELTRTCTTASLPGFGLFNSMHYHDVENAGVFRDTQYAKETLCNVYGVDPENFDSLDEAEASITGYNLTLARQQLEVAYAKAKAAGDITDTDKVVLTVGTSTDNENTRRLFNFLNNSMIELARGTSLEGRFELEFDASFGTRWADDFRDGAYDICTGGWSGAAWDPGYFLLAYLDPSYMYSTAWETDKVSLTFNPYDDGDSSHQYTGSLIWWYKSLNGTNSTGAPDWSIGSVDTEVRLRIIAKLEEIILSEFYSCPLYNDFSAQLNSYKIELGTDTYNTFMGYGGIRYITYNYTDAEWGAVKAEFDYKK